MEIVELDVEFGVRWRFWEWVEIIVRNGSLGGKTEILQIDLSCLGSGWEFWG